MEEIMRIKFKNLMLEITRQCGMNCDHCMRGEAEDVDMEYDVIYTICEKATHIEQLSITGGEPSLAPEKIDLGYTDENGVVYINDLNSGEYTLIIYLDNNNFLQ